MRNSENIFLVDIEKDILFGGKGYFSKEPDWKRQEKDETKKWRTTKGVSLKEMKKKKTKKATREKHKGLEIKKRGKKCM